VDQITENRTGNTFQNVANIVPLVQKQSFLPFSQCFGSPFVDQTPSVEQTRGRHLPKRTGASIEYNEYCILAHLFTKLSEAPSEVQDWVNGLGFRPRDRLKALTGVNATACDVAIRFSDLGYLSTGNLMVFASFWTRGMMFASSCTRGTTFTGSSWISGERPV